MAGVQQLLMTKCNLRVIALDDVIVSYFSHRFIVIYDAAQSFKTPRTYLCAKHILYF